LISKKHIFFIFLVVADLSLRSQFARFRHLTIEDGLTQNYVSCFAQDKKGFIWIGTQDGLNKYDGVKITTYRASLTDTNSLPHNNIRFIYIDADDILWGATGGGGMFKMDLKTNNIFRFSADSTRKDGISNNSASYIVEYEPGKLYVSTLDGLNIFDKKTEKFTVYKKGGKNDVPFLSNNLRYTTVDKEGHFWFGHPNIGATEYDPKTKQCTYYNSTTPLKLNADNVRGLYCDSKGLIWISSWANGACVIDKKNNIVYNSENTALHPFKGIDQLALVSQFYEDKKGNILFTTAEHGLGKLEAGTYKATLFENNKDDAETINDNTVFSIFQDRSGLIWCGTWKGGVNILDPRVLNFGYYKHEGNISTSISTNLVFSFCEKSSTEMYVGTGGGVSIFNTATKTFSQLPYYDVVGGASIRHNTIILNIYKDTDGSIWLSSFGAGMYRYFPDKNKYINYPSTGDTNTLSFHTPRSVVRDKKNRLWVATEGGLNLYNPEKDNFIRIQNNKGEPGALSSDFISCMVMQKDGKIWIGTIGSGVNLFDPDTRKAKLYAGNKIDLPADAGVTALCLDKKGDLWVATTGGLFLLNTQNGNVASFRDLNPVFGLPIASVEEDNLGNIWFSNTQGLCCFNPKTKEYTLYSTASGIQGKQFSYGASCVHTHGKLFFGGLNGLNYFDPKDISLNTTPPKVALTEFTALNKPYKLPLDVSYTDEITLSYKNYFFEFDFAALDYTNPVKNFYAYKLEGFNENWVNIGHEQKVAFTNLDPGTYSLLIKAANNDGFWGEPIKIKLIITPPFWRTTWFYLLCIVSAGLLIYGFIKRRERQLRLEKTILENKVEERTIELKIEKQKVEEAHKDIKDSINYAKKIQEAQMPTEKYIEKKLKDLKK
jgi:ligand-binding sensor domain-containing protein